MKYTQLNNSTAVLKFFGQIHEWWISAGDFTATLEEIEEKYANLIIRMHCYGGSVFEGNVIYNALAATKLNVEVEIVGVAASMATIAMLPAAKIKIAQNAFIMIHQPSSVTEGNADTHFSTGKLLKKMEANFIAAYTKATNKLNIPELFNGQDHWFSAEEAVEMGLAHEIIAAADAVVLEKPAANTPVEKVYARYTALLKTSFKTTNMDKNQLISTLQLKGVDANSSDTAVLQAVTATLNELKTENTNLKTQMKAVCTQQAEALIAAKEASLKTKFTAEQRQDFLKIAENVGLTTLNTVLEAYKPVPIIANLIKPEGNSNSDTERAGWGWDDYQAKDPAALEAMSETERNQLYLKKFPDAKL